jgi:hypothetical protein
VVSHTTLYLVVCFFIWHSRCITWIYCTRLDAISRLSGLFGVDADHFGVRVSLARSRKQSQPVTSPSAPCSHPIPQHHSRIHTHPSALNKTTPPASSLFPPSPIDDAPIQPVQSGFNAHAPRPIDWLARHHFVLVRCGPRPHPHTCLHLRISYSALDAFGQG